MTAQNHELLLAPQDASIAASARRCADSPASETFTVKRSAGLFESEEWTVTLTADAAVFVAPGDGERITVPRSEARSRIRYVRHSSFWNSSDTISIADGEMAHSFTLVGSGKSLLEAWLPPRTQADLAAALRKWGTGLIVLGGVHFVFSDFLDPAWGGVIAVIGVLNLLVPKRGMFIVNGLALVLVGVMNFLGAMQGSSTWATFGVFQVIWGVQEMRKFGQYALSSRTAPLKSGIEKTYTKPV